MEGLPRQIPLPRRSYLLHRPLRRPLETRVRAMSVHRRRLQVMEAGARPLGIRVALIHPQQIQERRPLTRLLTDHPVELRTQAVVRLGDKVVDDPVAR